MSTITDAKPPDVCSILVNHDFIKSVVVPEAKEHQEGYTVYKILLQASRKKVIDDDPLTYVHWKRFRDLHKLYRRVALVHTQLYLKGTVPAFPKPDYFGRHDPLVVEDRRHASEQLLAFVLQNSVLCQCEAVLLFFSGAEVQKSHVLSSTIPSNVIIPGLSPTLQKNESTSRSESSDMSDEFLPAAAPPAKRDDELLSIFDPFSRSDETNASENKAGCSNLEILSSVVGNLQISSFDSGDESNVFDTPKDVNVVASTSFSSSPNVLPATMRSATSNNDPNEHGATPAEVGKQRTYSSGEKPRWRSKIADFFPKVSPSTSKKNSISHDGKEGDLKTTKSESQLFRKHSTTGKMFANADASPVRNKASKILARRSSLDYVLQAAEFISSAQKAEEENAFDLAFTCYKSAVMLLLQGVQDEKDLTRRNAVRLKTAKYLKKAEKLFNSYIASDQTTAFCLDGFTTRFLSNFGVMGFQNVYSDLAQYRPVRVLDGKVQMVEEIATGAEYVIKVLDKSCYSNAYSASKILDQCVPTRVPHMVKLVKFWDTETAALLLLEYASGGKLWHRLRPHFERCRRLAEKCVHEDYQKCEGTAQNDDGQRANSKPKIFTVSGITEIEKINGEPFDDDEFLDDDETLNAEKLFEKNEKSPFEQYEQQISRARFSADDSFSLDTAPMSAGPYDDKTRRKFSLIFSDEYYQSALAKNETSAGVVDECTLRKWIGQLTVALGYLHAEGLICRDLTPDNLLLDSDDNLLLTFFSEWGGVDRSFNTRAAMALYSAPEVDGTINEPITDAADWWSLGVILYEMVTGTPLHFRCPQGIAAHSIIPMPDYLSVELKDLILRLIKYDAEDRLGSCFGGVEEIKMHPFFIDFDWSAVELS